MKVLVIEDDAGIIRVIKLAFQIRWPEADVVSTNMGRKGIEMAETESPDLITIDLGLPDISGFEVLENIRRFSSVPIIMITVSGDENDIVNGLELGADEYIVKPFKQLEFLARAQALIRRQQQIMDQAPISYGFLRFGPSMSKPLYKGKSIDLTQTEGIILYTLMKSAGNVVTYNSLAEAVWGDYYPGADESIRVYISHLRKKIEENPNNPKIILTKIGVGYYLSK